MQINVFKCAVKHFLENDVLIYDLISKFGPVELKVRRNYFSALTTSIIGQQLSVQSAKAIVRRFNSHFEGNLSPKSVYYEKSDKLRALGLSNAKTQYVKDLAEKLLSGEVNLRGISNKNEDDIMTELKKVKGIGPWTVHMFLIFVLGRPNILPVDDLGIRKAIMLNYNVKKLPNSDFVAKLSNRKHWSPYNTYASIYLWKSIDGN